MSLNESQNINSVTMDLENLRQQYSNLLIQYQSAVADYINYINTLSTNSKQELVSIQGQAFNGTGSDGQSSATTLQDCMASCSNSSTCTGATFISNKCEIRIGDSPIVPSTQDSYAIIPKGKQLLLNMENINQQLLNINNELSKKIKVSEPLYYEENNQNKLKNKELIKNYQQLLEERGKIELILKEYETLDNTENQNQIKITKNYYTYILLLILAIVVIFLLNKIFSKNTPQQIQYGGELGTNAYYIILGLIIFVVILHYIIKYLTL